MVLFPATSKSGRVLRDATGSAVRVTSSLQKEIYKQPTPNVSRISQVSQNNAPSLKIRPSDAPGTKTVSSMGMTSSIPSSVPVQLLGTGITAGVISSLATGGRSSVAPLPNAPTLSSLGPAGLIAQVAASKPVGNAVTSFASKHPVISALGSAALGGIAGAVIATAVGKFRQNADGSLTKIRRRTNYSNSRALRRSLTRVAGFNRLVKSVDKAFRRAAPPSSRRPSRGVITRAEARRALEA